MPTNSLGPGFRPAPAPTNPAAPRQFGAFGGRAMPARSPGLGANIMQRQQAPRPMPPRAPQPMMGNQFSRPQQAPPPRNPMMGAGASMGAAMMSDERSKQRIKELEDLNDQYASLLDTPAATANVRPKAPPTADLDRSNARALGEAGSYSYEYKNPSAPGAAPGRQAGPMAQELERIPGVVGTGPDGFKRVDTGRLALATASATGDQERRLRELEEERGLLSDDDDELSRELAAGEQRALANIRGGR
jgi:hypothetical protein